MNDIKKEEIKACMYNERSLSIPKENVINEKDVTRIQLSLSCSKVGPQKCDSPEPIQKISNLEYISPVDNKFNRLLNQGRQESHEEFTVSDLFQRCNMFIHKTNKLNIQESPKLSRSSGLTQYQDFKQVKFEGRKVINSAIKEISKPVDFLQMKKDKISQVVDKMISPNHRMNRLFIGEVLKQARNDVDFPEPQSIKRDKAQNKNTSVAKRVMLQKMMVQKGQLSVKQQQMKKQLEYAVRTRKQSTGINDYELSSI